MKSWCAYQERSQDEVRQKLRSAGIAGEAAENIIIELISLNFLNEERFAIAFARGKFRIKKWGRIKIRNGLREKKVSAACVDKALHQIEEEEYAATLQQLLQQKWRLLKESHPLKKRHMVLRQLQSKGYELELIMEALTKQTEI